MASSSIDAYIKTGIASEWGSFHSRDAGVVEETRHFSLRIAEAAGDDAKCVASDKLDAWLPGKQHGHVWQGVMSDESGNTSLPANCVPIRAVLKAKGAKSEDMGRKFIVGLDGEELDTRAQPDLLCDLSSSHSQGRGQGANVIAANIGIAAGVGESGNSDHGQVRLTDVKTSWTVDSDVDTSVACYKVTFQNLITNLLQISALGLLEIPRSFAYSIDDRRSPVYIRALGGSGLEGSVKFSGATTDEAKLELCITKPGSGYRSAELVVDPLFWAKDSADQRLGWLGLDALSAGVCSVQSSGILRALAGSHEVSASCALASDISDSATDNEKRDKIRAFLRARGGLELHAYVTYVRMP